MWDNIKYEIFGKKFLNYYIANGLESLTKKDTESLVAYLLIENSAIDDKDFYKIAIKLRITESKLRSLYAHARLRFNLFDDQFLLQEIKSIFINKGFKVIKSTDGNSKIEFVLIDSLLRMSLEHQLLLINSYSDSSFNKNIVRIDTNDFSVLYTNLLKNDQLDLLKLPNGSSNAKDFAIELLKKYFSGLAEEGGKATIRLIESSLNPVNGISQIIQLFR